MLTSWKWRTAERRIGIVGLANAGKTVLLTSLIDHLRNHEPDRFRLGDATKPASLRKFRTLPVSEGTTAFDIDLARKALGNEHRWPRKTKDRYEYACSFQRSDWRFNEAELLLCDLPGERLADVSMLGQNYATWSDRWHQYAQDDRRQMQSSKVFLDALAVFVEHEPLTNAYREALGQAMLDYKANVSPSTFWLDTKGALPKGTTVSELAQGRFSGLPNAEFVPLPSHLRTAHPALAAAFETNYLRYRTDIVEPYLAALGRCHTLIVVVDVVGLLGSGTGAANDYRRMLAELFEVVRPGEDVFRKLGRTVSEAIFQFRPRWITKVAFFAPKIDLIHPTDRDRLRRLLQSFVGRHATDYDGLEVAFFTGSAVVSTEPMPADAGARMMRGRRSRDAEGNRVPYGEAVKYPVSEVPLDWPDSWEAGQFVFPEVYPEIAQYQGVPPKQMGLDRLLDFAMN